MYSVRVYNDNIYPYKEKFKGDLVEIPSKKFVDMDYFDAVEFLGQYTPIQLDGGGAPLPTSYKMLRIVKQNDFKLEDSKKIICNACGLEFDNADKLEAHVSEKHIDDLADEEEQKKRRKK